MRRQPLARSLAPALFLWLLPGWLFAAAPATRHVAELTADESLRIRYVSAGSYHLQERLIVIRGGAEKSAAVSPATRESVGMPRDDGGFVLLDGFDVHRLDRLFAFYRSSGRPHDCVIREDIVLTWMKRGIAVEVERFADASCLAARDPGRLTLRELVLRASAAQR